MSLDVFLSFRSGEEEMSKAPKHNTFTFWSPAYLMWQPEITGD